MGNSPSKILFRLREHGHISEEEYTKLKEAIALTKAEREPTQFLPIHGSYDYNIACKKCGYTTTWYDLQDSKYCPRCGKLIKKERD